MRNSYIELKKVAKNIQNKHVRFIKPIENDRQHLHSLPDSFDTRLSQYLHIQPLDRTSPIRVIALHIPILIFHDESCLTHYATSSQFMVSQPGPDPGSWLVSGR